MGRQFVIGASPYQQDTGRVTVDYSAATKSYTVTFQGQSATFGPADQVLQNEEGTAFEKGPDNFGRSRFTDPRIQYMEFGFWRTLYVSSTSYHEAHRSFVYGSTTVDSDMPRTGTADFQGRFVGIGTTPSTYINWEGQGTISVNFGSGTLTGQLPLLGKSVESPLVYDISLAFTGSFGAGVNDISGTVSAPGQGYSGTFIGNFFGPNARELGLAAEFGNGEVFGSGVFGGIDQTKQ